MLFPSVNRMDYTYPILALAIPQGQRLNSHSSFLMGFFAAESLPPSVIP